MGIFNKGAYKPIPADFRTLGILSLQELSKFQDKFKIYDTDTTINSIRDAIVANYLGFDLLNFDKHGFDAKKSKKNEFLEIKECSVSSKRLGGTWSDTNEEKAKAFSDKRLFTAVAIWKGASDLQFIIYGQHKGLGKYLLERVISVQNSSTRSTQNVGIEKLIKDYGFNVVCPPDKEKELILQLIINYKRNLAEYVKLSNIKRIQDF
ncbi:MAG: hypothetical protein COX07_03770 [Bacteroidetes bacterium CG23_combo_of_CG06-09_8_20_14_all_32_9]|nr:MAG: hypothetical protein COX07_03770 [Bacteroidetes bacterium CG23_combo_of_CG06-09_8_20_14_all_32_9]